jgi:UDP-N-acetylmuramate-alanine ligase
VGKENRVSGKDIVSAIAKTQPQVFYEPLDERIIKWLLEKTKQDDIIVFMSSGGLRFTRLIEDTINGLKEPKN